MRIYQMGHAELEDAFLTDIKRGLTTKTKEKKKKSTIRSFKDFISYFSAKVHLINYIAVICYLVAAVFSVLNQNFSILRTVLVSFLLSTAFFVATIIFLYHCKNKYHHFVKKGAVKIEVIRGGVSTLIEADDLQPGDLLVLKKGSILQCDARIIEANQLLVDESIVFGHSLAVEKNADILMDDDILPQDQTNMLWKGAAVLEGSSIALVVALGEDCYVEKTGGRKKKKRNSSFYDMQNNIGKIFCYAFLIAVILFLLACLMLSGRFVEAFLVAGALLGLIAVNPIVLITELSFYHTAIHLLSNGIRIQNIEAFDEINRQKELFFDYKNNVDDFIEFSSIYSIFGTDEENHIYFSLCNDTGANQLPYENEIEAAREQYPIFLREKDAQGNTFCVFAKGGKSILIAMGYWAKMLPYVSMLSDEAKEVINREEQQGKIPYLMTAFSYDYIPGHVEIDSLLQKMKPIGLPIYIFKMEKTQQEQLRHFGRLGMKNVLISDWSQELTKKLMNTYGFAETVDCFVNNKSYAVALKNQRAPIVTDDSAPYYRNEASIIAEESGSLPDMIYKVKCMFCGIQRGIHFLSMIVLSVFAIVCIMFLKNHSASSIVYPLALLTAIMMLPCYYLMKGVKNPTENKLSYLLGAFCGIFAMICAFSDGGNAILTLALSVVVLSEYFTAKMHKGSRWGMGEIVLYLVLYAVLIAFILIIFDGWLMTLLLSMLPLVCTVILDYIY